MIFSKCGINICGKFTTLNGILSCAIMFFQKIPLLKSRRDPVVFSVRKMFETFFIEKLVGENWHRYAGAFDTYQRAFLYYDRLCVPRKLFRIARYENVEVMKIEEE